MGEGMVFFLSLPLHLKVICQSTYYNKKVYDQIFLGERGGGWGGGSSEGCLKWGGGGSLRDISKNISKQGLGKGKS